MVSSSHPNPPSPQQSTMPKTSISIAAGSHLKSTLLRNFPPKSDLCSHSFIFFAGAMTALLLVFVLSTVFTPTNNISFALQQQQLPSKVESPTTVLSCSSINRRSRESPSQTFYDNPKLSYTLEKPIRNWDQKRRQWLQTHPQFAGNSDRIFLVTGSQTTPCRNPTGDNLLLRFFKNKVDYCRIHGYEIFYNNVLLHPKMHTYWAKYPIVRSAMIAHPEAEWIWWVDSDAAFTDMEFKLPLQKYKNHNLVVHGWENLIYQNKSWVSLNAGIFLIRNCQWSLDFMNVWASFGPQTSDYEKWGKTLRSVLPDKTFPESDDQSALVYLLLMQKQKWGAKIFIESDYYFQGYWLEIVETFEKNAEKYESIEKSERFLRRRHAEKVSEFYGELREQFLKEAGHGKGSWRRPFITHFTGCQPCSGQHNVNYSADNCREGMERALNLPTTRC